MKKIINLILGIICLVPFKSFSQEVVDNFSGWANVTSITGNTVVINSFGGNQSKNGNTWTIADMVTSGLPATERYVLFVDCSNFQITNRVGNTLTILDLDAGNSVFPSAGQRIGLVKETLISGQWLGTIPQSGDGNAGAISGIDNALAGCISSHYAKRSQNILANATDVTKYVGSGVPAFTPTTNEPKLAQGLSSPYPLYKWNGSAWVLDGSGTLDTSLYKVMSRNIADGLYLSKEGKLDSSNISKIGAWQIANSDSFRTITGKLDGFTIGTANTVLKSFEITSTPTGIFQGSFNNGNLRYNLDMASFPVTNGLAKKAVTNEVKLGGTLTEATAIITDATNTFALQGLQNKNGITTDSLVTVDNTGKLSKIDAASIGQEVTTVNTIAELSAITNAKSEQTAFVKDSLRGGTFTLSTLTGNTVDNGIIFPSSITGYVWKRDISNASSLNVKWFGAKGDNLNDDAPSIQATINYAAASGAGVYIPTGLYRIYTEITIPNTFSKIISGAGANKSLLVYYGTAGGNVIHASKISFCTFEDFGIDGVGNAGYAMKLDSITYSTFKNLRIQHTVNAGISYSYGWENSFYDLLVQYSKDGLYLFSKHTLL